jgi:hypothetical protein
MIYYKVIWPLDRSIESRMHRQVKIDAWKIGMKGYVNRPLAGCQGVTRPYPPPTTLLQILVLSLTGMLCMSQMRGPVEFATSIGRGYVCPVRYGDGVLWPVAQRAARSLTVAMKYAPLVLVMRCSRLA